MLKKILAGLVTAVLSLGIVALVASPASAHHNTIKPKVVCATDGSYVVTWSVTNSESRKTEIIEASNKPSVVPVNTSLGFSETKTFTETVPAPADLELILTGFWDGDTSTTRDDVRSQDRGFLSKSSFPTGCLKVTPEATEKPSVCNGPNTYTDPTYTLKAVTGVKYTVDGVEKPAATYTATNGTTVTIVATVTDPKYKIEGKSSWTFTFKKPDDGTCVVKVDPVKPSVELQVCNGPGQYKLARYFIPNTTGVLYSVLVNGTETPLAKNQWHDVPDGVLAVEVIARPDSANYYVFSDGSSSKSYPLTFNDAGDCLDRVTPKGPTVVTATCDVQNHPGVVPEQSYTLRYVAHVVYLVSENGATPVERVITQDTKYVVAPGTTIVVTAKPDDPTKYVVDPTWSFTKAFGDPGDCKGELTPLVPTWTDQFCDDNADPRVLVPGAVTITAVAGLTYYLDGGVVNGLVVGVPTTIDVAPGLHELTVTIDDPSKYKLAAGVTLPFERTILAGECLPTHPLLTPLTTSKQIGCFTAGSYTLDNSLKDSAAVIWTVNGSQVAEGKYTFTGNGTVTITATPNAPDYGFEPNVQTTWTYDFKKPTVCDIETLALTGQNPTGMLIAADALVVAGLAMFAMRAVRRGRPQQA